MIFHVFPSEMDQSVQLKLVMQSGRTGQGGHLLQRLYSEDLDSLRSRKVVILAVAQAGLLIIANHLIPLESNPFDFVDSR